MRQTRPNGFPASGLAISGFSEGGPLIAGFDWALESSAGACAAETVAARSNAEATKNGVNPLSRLTVTGLRVGFMLLPDTLSIAQFSLVLDLWALALA